MAKFGLLYLNGGVWDGQRIVSQEWVEASTRPHADLTGGGYGYQWWLRAYDYGSESAPCFFAAGWGGQRIHVFPALDMVVVFTGGNYVSEDPAGEIIASFILPAVQ